MRSERKCTVEGCGRRHHAKGWCQKHHYHMVPGQKEKQAIRGQGYYRRPGVKQRLQARGRTLEHKAKCRERTTLFSAELVERCRSFQRGRCDICQVVLLLGGKKPDSECADHCHRHRVPRGLLCMCCNVALGIYENHQRRRGVTIKAYEFYLTYPPVRRMNNLPAFAHFLKASA